MVTRRKGRKTGKYRVRITVAPGYVRHGSFSSLVDASRAESEWVRERELRRAGLGLPSVQILTMEYAHSWLAKQEKALDSRSTYVGYETNLRLHLLPYAGPRPIGMINTVEWREWLDHVQDDSEFSNAQFNRIRATAHVLYEAAMSDGVVNQNPISAVPRKSEKVKARPIDYWETDSEMFAYAEAAEREGGWARLFASVAINTGARKSEVQAIRVGDVELDHDKRCGTIFLRSIYEASSKEIRERTKSGEGMSRYVPIPAPLYDVLEQRLASGLRGKSDFLLHDDAGKPVTTAAIDWAHHKMVKAAGVKEIPPHGLRKAFASKCRRDGMSLDDCRAILGHGSLWVTLVYAKTSKMSVKAMAPKGVGVERPIPGKIIGIGRK